MAMKTLFGIWKDRVPIKIQKHVEQKLVEMKQHADPTGDMSRSAVICYYLVLYIRQKVEDRVHRILLLLEVMDWAKECGLGFDKELYREVEMLISVIEEPLQSVLTNFLLEIKK